MPEAMKIQEPGPEGRRTASLPDVDPSGADLSWGSANLMEADLKAPPDRGRPQMDRPPMGQPGRSQPDRG